MSRKLVVEILGDTRAMERSFARAQRSTKGFGRDIERAGRGSLTAAIGFQGLGRSVAFASGAFLGGAGLAYAIKSTVGAAMEAQRVQAQLTNVLAKQGLATRANVSAIDARTAALSQMSGFDDELATQTFVNLLRVTGNVTKALRLNAIAADVARGRNISLDAAAKLVTKAALGQAGALRRVGIAAKEGATGTELLDLLQRKFVGSAKAYGETAAGAQDRFRVALENTQEVIGTAVLPSITKVLNKAADWLNDTENQKKVQDAANHTTERAAVVVTNLHNAYNDLKSAYAAVSKVEDPFGVVRLLHMTSANDRLSAFVENFKVLIRLQKRVADGYDAIEKARLGQTAAALATRSVALPSAKGSSFVGRPLAAAEQRALALARTGGLGGAAEAAAVKAELAADRAALAFAQRMFDEKRGNTKALVEQAVRLETEIRAGLGRLAGIAAETAARAREKADKIKDARERTRQAVLDAIGAGASGSVLVPGAFDRARAGFRAPGVSGAGAAGGTQQSLQFLALGLTAAGEQLAPTRSALQSQLAKVTEGLAGTILDTKPNRNLIGRLRRVLGKEFKGLTRETRLAVQGFLDALNPGGGGSPFSMDNRSGVNITALTRGFDRQTADLIRHRIRAQGLTVPGGGRIDIHQATYLDGRLVERGLVPHAEKRRRRTATQTRGRQLP